MDPSTDADLHFTDRLALVAYDLRQISLWLEGFRDRWEAAGLPAPVFSDGSDRTVRLVVVCFNPTEFDAARHLLSDDSKAELVERNDDHYVRAGRRFGTVVIDAIVATDLLALHDARRVA